MSERNDGGPAYPVWELNGSGQPEMTCFGMSLRDYFAGQAVQGWSANPLPNASSIHDVAARAYRLADAMLAAREA